MSELRTSYRIRGLLNFTMVHNVAVFHADYLIARIPEISYFLSSALMIFASDYIMGRFLIRRLRKLTFLARTSLFLLYGLFMFPALVGLGAFVLREAVLYPFKEWIILLLVVFFLFIGVLLSIRYNMKIKLKVI
jgi:hypothetical protein